MGNKLVKDLDEETWRKFAGYSKSKGKKIGEMLSKLLEDFLKDKIK